ncbi:MAG TPA: PEGA domain-containing protein [Kofleriaceae bacterium]
MKEASEASEVEGKGRARGEGLAKRGPSAVSLLVLALAACGPPPAVNGVRDGQAVVLVTSNVGDAQVYVDGRFVGMLGLLHGGLAMDAGHHRIELRHDDYFARYAELTVARAGRTTLDLEMEPVLP